MRQCWANQLLLHWNASPAEIQSTLPEGLSVDPYYGAAYVGIGLFCMPEANGEEGGKRPSASGTQGLKVQTYVTDRAGVPGIWFYSLDCNSIKSALVMRFCLGLSFHPAEIATSNGTAMDFCSRRLETGNWSHYRYRPTGPERDAPPASLEFFLLERYHLYSRRTPASRLRRIQFEHVPCRFRDVDLEEWSVLPAELNNLKMVRGRPALAWLVEDLQVKVYPSTPAGFSLNGQDGISE